MKASRCVASLCVLLGAMASAGAQIVERTIPGDPVRTEAGAVSGLQLPGGIRAYLGIPFAAAPVGALRWRAPQPVTPWRGVYHADRKSPECIQVLRGHEINHYFGEEATSEDCLYLNLWAPAGAHAGQRLPVIVYLYGGGNTIGSAGMALYDGASVARRGALFVNFNYRLGALGFLAHPGLSAESPQHSSGNYAHLDQVAALQWVQRNVARFGGDPAKVIICGQSAGGLAVSLLQVSPLAKGLFRGAVAMSGSLYTPGFGSQPPLADAEQIGVAFAAALKTPDIAGLRALPADRLLAVQRDCQLGCSGSIQIGGANIDGYFLPESPAALRAAHRHSDVPVIAGYTRDESSNALRTAHTVAEYTAAARNLYGDAADVFLQLYPVAADDALAAMGESAARDAGMAQGARRWAQLQSADSRSPVFLFEFAQRQPFNPSVVIADHPEAIGAYHTSDVPYWFGTLEALNRLRPTRLWSARDRELSEQMTDALIRFARTGEPGSPRLAWPAWTAGQESLLQWHYTPELRHFDTRRMDFFAQHPSTAAGAPLPRATRD